jgi:Fe-S-cluster-containing dehydrogenase component/CRP-like cAMP-binding protein
MDSGSVERVMSTPHFQLMDESKFPDSLKLKDIIANDCRIISYDTNQLIVHAGAYTNSAFLILSGSATLVLSPGIGSSAWGQSHKAKPSVFKSFKKYLSRSRIPEVRKQINSPTVLSSNSSETQARAYGASEKTNISSLPFIKDLDDRVLNAKVETIALRHGDIFGESAVLGRTMIKNTVVASKRTEVLEIRWQGLRDLCKYQTEFKDYIDTLYRRRGLIEELLSNPLFEHVPTAEIHKLATQALFEVHGNFEWHKGFQKIADQIRSDDDINHLIQSEPVIAHEGDYPDGLLLIRNGFSRVSRKINHGHYTVGHLTGGDLFGLSELYDSWVKREATSLKCSLRALGYTDVIRIPSSWLETNVFSAVRHSPINLALEKCVEKERAQHQDGSAELKVDRKITEFLVENRIINGTQTMMIDLERCVRCDDCVTACSNAHDNNPRFNRQGPRIAQYMIANACMHCDDPVCMIGCPTGAIHRATSGAVTINDETCIGCSSCANSCPYDSIRMVPIRNGKGDVFTDEYEKPILKATKCDLCSSVAGGPACERACSHDALVRLDVKDIRGLADWVNR